VWQLGGAVSEGRARLYIFKMDCRKFEEQISEYLDGLLAKNEASRFAAHSLQCRACRSLMDDIKGALYDAKEPIEASDNFENVLLSVQDRYAPLSCAAFEALITEFLDGFVPALTYHRFESHANECCECSSLLTEVVYAVAACHSVHTYEEVEVPEALQAKLTDLMPEHVEFSGKRIARQIAAFVSSLLPRATQSPSWSFATASSLAVAMFALLLFSFSDDGTVSGIFRQAQVKIGAFYSHSTDIYAQKDEVIAELQKVRSNIDDVWNTLGGETEVESAKKVTSE
jgi:anti-sigma factor RsiW